VNLEKLKSDIEAGHPCLRFVTFPSVTETAEHIRNVHRSLMSDQGGVDGYLYQIQIEKVKQLRKELEQCQLTTNK